MALTVTWQRDPRHTSGRVRRLTATAAQALRTAARTVTRPHRAALTTLLHMPLFVAGLACADFAAFHLAHGWGWLATGASLIVAELAAADDTDRGSG